MLVQGVGAFTVPCQIGGVLAMEWYGLTSYRLVAGHVVGGEGHYGHGVVVGLSARNTLAMMVRQGPVGRREGDIWG